MYGAILGDMIGAPYEFLKEGNGKTKDFPLFIKTSVFTDDSVMTVAIADALLGLNEVTEDAVKKAVIESMQRWGQKYPEAGYGANFYGWIFRPDPEPYESWGNGSAMRVSSVGWLYDSIEKTREVARWTAEVSHNHPEGVKGAEATASAIFMARNGATKDEIRDYIVNEFGYDLSRTCDEIRPGYHFDVSCQGTIPPAVTAFLEGEDFEDVIRTAVSLGGDCDTLTCIAGSMAEAFYGVPEEMKTECRARVTDEMVDVIDRFYGSVFETVEGSMDPFHRGNERIEEAIARYHVDDSEENLYAILDTIRDRMHEDGHFFLPVIRNEEDDSFTFRTIKTEDGKYWNVAFTSQYELEKGAETDVISFFIDGTMKNSIETEAAGIIINPWGRPFMLVNSMIEAIFTVDGDVEYSVPDDDITAELLEDGSFLKKAIEICNRNRTQLNLIKLARILRDSTVWVPCTAVFSEADMEAVDKVVREAMDKGDEELQSLVGHEFVSHDEVRMVPDILQNDDDFFFPVFTSEEEMGEYGEQFSKIPAHFLGAMNLARNNEKDVKGIVINAFTEPFHVMVEGFDLIAGMKSSIEEDEDTEDE